MNAPLRIAALADWLHPRGNLWKAMVMMKAYFDESGTHGDSLITAIAGFVATKDVWTGVEAAWGAELAVYADKGVRSFHMTDCIAQKGEFANLDTFFSRALILKLSEVLRDHNVQAIWSVVINEDWDAVVTDPVFLTRFPKSFDLCFEHVVQQLWGWAKRNADGERVCPVFAYHPEFWPRMAEIGRLYGAQDWYKDVLGAIAFDYPDRLIPLQTADFVAHQVNKEFEHREYDELTLQNIGRTLALSNATAFNGMHIGGGFDARALQLTIERFKKTGKI